MCACAVFVVFRRAKVTYVANVLGSERLEVRVDRALSHDDDVQPLSRQVLALHAHTQACTV